MTLHSNVEAQFVEAAEISVDSS